MCDEERGAAIGAILPMMAFRAHSFSQIMTAAQRLQELGRPASVLPLLHEALNLDASLPSLREAVHLALAAGEIEAALRFLAQAEVTETIDDDYIQWTLECFARITEYVTAVRTLKAPIKNETLASSLRIGSDDLVVGSVGTFSPYEGLDVLLEACTELEKKGEKLKLLLVGDDQPLPLKDKSGSSAADIAETGLTETSPWLIQVGRVPHDQVADYYALLDAVVIPRKPLAVCQLVPPMKAAEALAYGKRLVVSDVAPLAGRIRRQVRRCG